MGLRRASARLLVLALVAGSAVGVSWTRTPATPAQADVAPAPWWSGDCDTNYWTPKARSLGWTGSAAHRLGASYLGVPSCGPRPSVDGSPNVVWRRAGWGEYEWQCVELAQRFMAQVYGVKAYQANGNQVVSHYSTAYGGGLVRINNGTAGQAPQPGDIISYNSSTNSNGHVAVVTSSSVNGLGNGSVMTMEQNYSANGWRSLSVVGWRVQPSGNLTPYGWLHDPQGRGNPGAVLPTSMNLLSNSSFELGTGAGWVAGWQPADITRTAVAGTSTAPASEGTQVLRLKADLAGSSTWQDVTTPTAVGRSFTFSAWVRSPDGTPVVGRLLLSSNGGTLERGQTYFTAGPKWTLVSAPLTITLSGHTGLRAEIVLSTANRSVDVDGTQLVDAGLANASFEAGTKSWAPRVLPSALTVQPGGNPAYALEGPHWLRLTATTAGASLGQTVAAVPQVNHAYTFSAWVRTPPGTAAVKGQLRLSALGGTAEVATQSFTTGYGWTLVSVPLSVTLLKHTYFAVEVVLTSTGQALDVDAAQLADDRLQNASLEQGTAGVAWQPWANASALGHAVLTGSFAHDGKNFLLLRTSTTNASIRQTPAVVPQPGRTYTFSAWLRSAPGVAGVSGRLRVMTLGGTAQLGQTLFTVGPKWTHVSAPLSVTSGGHSGMQVEIMLGTTAQNLYVDGTTLVAGDSRDADVIAPVLTLKAHPAEQVRSTSAGFSLAATDLTDAASTLVYRCTLDGVAAPCTTSRSYSQLAQGMHTFTATAVDPVGNVSNPVSWSWLVDTVAPAAGMTTPGGLFGLSPSATVTWNGSDAGSGIAGYDVQRRGAWWNGGFSSWAPIATGTAGTSIGVGVAAGATYCFQVRAHDAVGNVSAWSPERCLSRPLDDRSLAASTAWIRSTGATRFYGGSAQTTTRLGASLWIGTAQLDRVSLVVTRCPSCGKVGVYVGSTLVGTADLATATTTYQTVVVLPAFSLRSGQVRLKVLSSGKLVQVDGLGLSRS